MSGRLVDPARMGLRLGRYAIGQADALTDASFHTRAQEARRRLSTHMTPLDREMIAAKMHDCSYHVSRKVDGEFTLVVCRGSEAITLNPGGTVRSGLALLDEACERLSAASFDGAILVGELYYHRTDRRTRVHDVLRVTRQPDSQNDLDDLRFAVFDLMEVNGRSVTGSYPETFALIQRLFGQGERVHPVETEIVKTCKEVESLFARWVDGEDAEGLVARSEEAGTFKIKPRHNLDVAVIGYTEGEDDRAGLLHDMLVATMRPQGQFHILGRVGGGQGFNDDLRRAWLSDLKDIPAESEYSEINDQVAYNLVRPEIVVEISCLDFISQNTRGANIDRMVLDWDGPAETYRSVWRMPLCSPISPQFVRRREDKSAHPDDVGIRQLCTLLDIPMAERDAANLILPASEILRREVYTKSLKGQTMVRKLMLWQTNKDLHDPDFPAFVAYVTDFSPNRKTPLERDIRVSSSRDQIEQIFGDLSAEYIVKGWEAAA